MRPSALIDQDKVLEDMDELPQEIQGSGNEKRNR